MTIHTKDAGTWKAATPYMKKNGTWTEPNQVWTKDAGIWKLAYQIDTTPPAIPQLTLDIVDNRYITATVKDANTTQADISKIRLLVSPSSYPANQYSSGYVSTPDSTYPNEDWSEFIYAPSGGAHTSATAYTKEYPPNPVSSTALTGGRTYYFGAWAQDLKGNWSAGVFANKKMPDRTIPGGPGQPVAKVTEWTATFSQCFLGNDSLRWNGVYLYQGYWNAVDGAQESIIGFPSSVATTIKNATVHKVEVFMYSRAAYNPQTGFLARYQFHSAASAQPTLATVPRFGTFNTNIFKDWDGHWIDITGMGTAGWKSGVVRGLTFQPNTFDRHYSGLFEGHTQAHPPKLRITYSV